MNVGNIGPQGRRQRLALGIVALIVGAAVVLWLDLVATTRWWRLAAFPLFWGGILAVIEAGESTCVVLARWRVQNFDDGQGMCPVANAADAQHLAKRGRAITIRATLVAIVVMLMA